MKNTNCSSSTPLSADLRVIGSKSSKDATLALSVIERGAKMITEFFQTIFGSLWNIVLLLAVAALTGAVAQAIVGNYRAGCLASIGIGFLGALLGIWLAGLFHLPEVFTIDVGGISFPIVWALLGAMILLLIFRVPRRRRYY